MLQRAVEVELVKAMGRARDPVIIELRFRSACWVATGSFSGGVAPTGSLGGEQPCNGLRPTSPIVAQTKDMRSCAVPFTEGSMASPAGS